MIGRRGFLGGLFSALAAPAIVRAELLMPVRGIIMPVKQIIVPSYAGEIDLLNGRDLAWWVKELNLTEVWRHKREFAS